MKSVVLSVKDLSVTLNSERVLEDLSFDVNSGEILTILGPNGAGKTVLLRALIKALPYTGSVSWKKGLKIGYVPQRLPFIKELPLSVKEFFELKKVPEKRIGEVLRSTGLKDMKLLDKRVGDLSSGQFQRILVAWALAGNPDVLLFDEPFAGVDISSQETIYDFLEKLHKTKNLTIILVSHDLSIVYKFATRVLCLNKKGLCFGAPRKVLTSENLSKLYGGGVKFYSHNHS